MRARYEPKKARIEIIPMIDIMFFLLVFFVMITLHMIPSSGIPSRLPGSTTAQPLHKPDLTLAIDKNGVIHEGSQTFTPATLTSMLSALPDHGQAQVTISGDRDVSLQTLIRVMDACRAAGVTKIGLAARHQAGGTEGS